MFFDFLEKYYVPKDEVSQKHLNVIKKSSFVKEDKTFVRSSHLPLETFLVKCKRTEVKASPFKIADEQTLVHSIIEQNNFTNESLHVIGQQLDRIKEIVEKTTVSKPEKPLIDFLSQREKLNFKTSQTKTPKIVEKMLSNLKVKIEVLLQVLLVLFQEMRKKLFLKKIQILNHYLLFLLKRFLMMIYQKLKDLLAFYKKLVFQTYSS